MASNYFLITLPEDGNENFLSEYMVAPVSVVENPPQPSDDKQINPNMTLGEMMDKKISPAGMVPAWSEAARKKYEACVSPHIDTYKLAVDKINRGAQKDYNLQTYAYVVGSLGLSAGVSDLFNAFRGDKAIRARWTWKSSPTKVGITGNRGTFWATFVVSTIGYIYIRRETLKIESEDFDAQTNFFLKKLNECRQSNPYDMWRVMTPAKEYFEKVKWTPSGLTHPNRGNLINDLLNPEKKKKMFWLPQ